MTIASPSDALYSDVWIWSAGGSVVNQSWEQIVSLLTCVFLFIVTWLQWKLCIMGKLFYKYMYELRPSSKRINLTYFLWQNIIYGENVDDRALDNHI